MRLFQEWFPLCRKFGMTEKEFWLTNPRKILAYEQAWKDTENRKNEMMYMWWGNYGMSALVTALSGVLTPMFCGKQSQTKYVDKPMRIFEMTEEEEEAYKEEQTALFVEWCESMQKNWEANNTPDATE